jgi:predicted nucleic acid-binding protein
MAVFVIDASLAASWCFESIDALPILLFDPPSYDGVFALAERHALTVYDASYLDLAVRMRVPLASLDEHLRRAAMQSGLSLFDPKL